MKNISLLFILIFSIVFAQNTIPIQNIETEQIPDKYKGNSQYLGQSKLLVDGDNSTYPQPYWGAGSPLIYDLDLGSSAEVQEIKIWDFEGDGVIRVYTGSTNNWQQVGSVDLNSYNVEKTISVNKNTRWIRLEIDGKVSEVTVIGRGGNPPPNPPDTDIIGSLISVSSNEATVKLENLDPESQYNISVNGAPIIAFKTPQEPTEPPEPKRVIHISVDGLNSRILRENIDNLATFKKLMNEGAYSFASRTTPMNTETVPNHVSMWTGLQMSEHGIDYNGDIQGDWDSSISTVFSTLPDSVKSIGFVAKTKLATFLQAMKADQIVNNNDVGNTLALIDQYNKKLHGYYFWHISRLDDTGHASGWNSNEYANALSFVDAEIGKVLDAIDDNTIVIITADHGGGKPVDNQHFDFNDSENYTIPLFVFGDGVGNIELQDSIYNGATANTAVNALGLGDIQGSSIDPICLTCPKPLPPDTSNSSVVTLDKFVGTNVLADDPPNLVAPVAGNIRIYQYLKWLNADVSNVNTNAPLSEVKINFNPNDAFGFNHDASTKAFSELGLTYVTYFESAMYLTGNDKTWLNAVAFPRDKRSQLTDPNTWKYISHYYFQVAARYGHVKVDQSKLITDSEKLSGLGYLDILEGGNEKDRWWIGKDKADLSPEEHAAYYSAVYDGHMNTMQESGVYFGIKNADPNMKLMLGGLAFVDFDELLRDGKLDWFERFFGWFEQNRTKAGYDVYPIDIISFHDYPNTERKQRNLSGKGLDPESYKWYEKHKAFVEYLERRVPKKLQLVNNEFGYDRVQSSPQRAEPYAGFSAEQVAGFWTVRCMLEAWAAGLDHAAQFYFRDNNANGGGIFQSSGLTDKSQGYKPFQMYYYFATMRAAMKGHIFKSRTVEGDIIRYETENAATGKRGWVIWHWSKSRKQSTYQIDFNGSVLETRLQDNSMTGNQVTKNSQNGKVSISISEMPTFVVEN